jgi:hypothetical protein
MLYLCMMMGRGIAGWCFVLGIVPASAIRYTCIHAGIHAYMQACRQRDRCETGQGAARCTMTTFNKQCAHSNPFYTRPRPANCKPTRTLTHSHTHTLTHSHTRTQGMHQMHPQMKMSNVLLTDLGSPISDLCPARSPILDLPLA